LVESDRLGQRDAQPNREVFVKRQAWPLVRPLAGDAANPDTTVWLVVNVFS
jgi:hypothetical protein